MTELAVIEIKPEQAPALYVQNGLDGYLNLIREQVKEVPDLSTAKGRARIASLASQVSRSKTAIEKPGRDYLRQLKEAVKPAEAELRRFVTECDALRDEVRRPLTEWEEEQARIAAEAQAEAERQRIEAEQKAAEEALKKQVEADHEIALLLNEKFDRELAEKKAEAERQRIAHEEELKRQAAEKASREAEEKAQREREDAARREAELKIKAEQAERDRIAAEKRAEAEKVAAAEKAEREKKEAIEAEQRKAQEEAARIKREADAKEAARLAEEKRVAEENARRAADVEHRRTINRRVIADLVAQGIPDEHAKTVLLAIAGGKVPDAQIKY